MSNSLATDEPFGHLARHMNKIVDQLNKGYYSFYPNEAWTPNVNLYETEEAYQVCVDLAGVDKEKIDIEVNEQRLILKGSRAVPTSENLQTGPQEADPSAPARKARIHLMEIDHGSFARAVELPHNVQNHRITAEYRNGMLWIELPKS